MSRREEELIAQLAALQKRYDKLSHDTAMAEVRFRFSPDDEAVRARFRQASEELLAAMNKWSARLPGFEKLAVFGSAEWALLEEVVKQLEEALARARDLLARRVVALPTTITVNQVESQP
jgi:hypothetical protein